MKDHRSILIEYLEGELNEEMTIELEEKLKVDKELRSELEQIKRVLFELDEAPYPAPSDSMKGDFYQNLQRIKDENEVEAPQNNSKDNYQSYSWMKIAAAVSLIALSVFGGIYYQKQEQEKAIAELRNEIEKTRSTMQELLKAPQASTRISAVRNSADLASADKEILEALFFTLNFDENTNVRVAALEALSQFKNNPLVIKELIASLKFQDNPTVQIEIIQFLVDIKEKSAIDELQEIVDDENKEQFVRDEAQMGVFIIS